MMLFQKRDIERYTDSLAAYLPGGILFAIKSFQDSNFRKLLRGFAGELFRSNGLLIEYSEEILPDTTEKFLGEWESALNLSPGPGYSSSDRRRDILVRLASSGVQTGDDFVELAAIFGIPITVTGDTYTITIGVSIPLAETFPLEFAINFGSAEIELLRGLFEDLIPANCELVIVQV